MIPEPAPVLALGDDIKDLPPLVRVFNESRRCVRQTSQRVA
jgi:hypothetical protein